MRPLRPVLRWLASAVPFLILAALPLPAHAQAAAPPTSRDDELLRLRAVVDALRREVLELEAIRREQPHAGARVGVVDLARVFEGYARRQLFEDEINAARRGLAGAVAAKEGAARALRERSSDPEARAATSPYLPSHPLARRDEREAEGLAAAERSLAETRALAEATLRAWFDHMNQTLLQDIREESARVAEASRLDLVLSVPPRLDSRGAPRPELGAGVELLYRAERVDVTAAVVAALNGAPRAREAAPPLPAGAIEEALARAAAATPGPRPGPSDRPAAALAPAPAPAPTPAAPRPEERSLRYAMEVIVPRALGRPPLANHKVWSSSYRDDPEEVATYAGGFEHRHQLQRIVDGPGAVALAQLYAGETSGYDVQVLGIELAADWPEGLIEDIAPFHWVVLGRRFRLLIGGNSTHAAGLARFLASAELAPEDRFQEGSILPAAVYEERCVASLAADVAGEPVEGGFRIDMAPSPTGVLAQWTGRPIDLRTGDIVASVGGVAVGPSTSVEGLYRRLKHAEEVEIGVLRDGARVTVRAEVWPPRSTDALLRRLDRFRPDGLVGAPVKDHESKDPRRGRYEYDAARGWPVIARPWTGWSHDGRLFERFVVRAADGREACAVLVYATDLRTRAAQAAAVQALAEPAPFQWVFGVDRFVLAMEVDDHASHRPEVRAFVEGVRAYLQERGGEEVFGLLEDWR